MNLRASGYTCLAAAFLGDGCLLSLESSSDSSELEPEESEPLEEPDSLPLDSPPFCSSFRSRHYHSLSLLAFFTTNEVLSSKATPDGVLGSL